MSNMYDNAKTWNPFKGCLFDCSYCRPSFQAQAKRQKHNCQGCYEYTPHFHVERLSKVPKADIVFACGNGDIAFATLQEQKLILAEIAKRPDQTFYLQTKRPGCLYYLCSTGRVPQNVILVTTLETNIDEGYREHVTPFAPLPTERYEQFKALDHPRKVVTIEPIMEFHELTFGWQIKQLEPEYVWIGYNSKPKQVKLPEPCLRKTEQLIELLESLNIKVKRKLIREAI